MDDQNTPQTISLTPEPQPQAGGIELGSDPQVVPSTETATSRAFKAHTGLGDVTGKSFDDMYADIASGREKNLRQEIASNIDFRNAQIRQSKISDMLSGGQVQSTEDLRPLMESKPTDPSSVFERGYSKAVTDSLDTAASFTGSPMWKQANIEIPNLVNETKERGSLLQTYREYALTKLQDVQDEIQNQSDGEYLINKAAGWVPFLDEYEMRGATPGTSPFESLGFGTQLNIETRRLLSQNFDTYKSQFDDVLSKMPNPYLKAHYIQAVLGQSSSDIFESNVGTGLNASMIPGIGAVPKAVSKGMELLTGVRQATRDVIEAAKLPQATKATMSNAAGDAGEAAVHQTTDNFIKDIQGTSDFEKRAFESLTTNLRLDMQKMYQNAGRFGQEGVNRIESRMWSVAEDVLNKITDVAKVDRVPELKASEDVMRSIKEDIKQDYRGMPNKLMDVGNPVWDRLGNRWMAEHQIGTESGEFFGSPLAAENDAKLNGLILRKPSDQAVKLDTEIGELQRNLNEPPAMDADVNELNRYQKMEERLVAAKNERLDLDVTGTDGYDIKQQGLGFYISKYTPIKENSPVMRDALAKTAYDKIYQPGWVKSVLGWIRTPEEVLSNAENDQRHIATFSPSVLMNGFEKASKEINDLPRKYWDDWTRALNVSRFLPDANGDMGAWFKNPADLEDFYQRNFSRWPERQETEAYFAFVRNYELERVLRDLSVLKNKSRLGAEQHRLKSIDANGKTVYSPWIDAIEQREFPGGDDTVMVHSRENGHEAFFQADSIVPNKLNLEYREKVKNGQMRVLRVYDPELRQLEGYGRTSSEKVRYILTDGQFETKPLSYGTQVNRREGGHFAYEAETHAKQAKVIPEKIRNSVRYHYEGDTTAFALPPIEAEARKVIEHLNGVREHIDAGRLTEAEQYHNQHFGMPWEEMKAKYDKGILNSKEPFHFVRNNETIMSISKEALENRYTYLDKVTGQRKPNLVDGTKGGSDARQFQVQYTGARDAENLMQFKNVGTKAKPVFNYEAAPMIDPITTYERALTRIVNSTFMDDIKISSAEHWLEQAKGLMVPSEQEIRSAPFRHFYKPEWKKDADPVVKMNLLSAKQKIDQFLGTQSKISTFVQRAQQDVVDSIYQRAGEKTALIANDVLTRTTNADDFARGVTFHAKLGMFNVPSFLKQFSTLFNVFAIAGARPAGMGTMSMILHQWARINGSEEILNHLDNIATRLSGLIPGEYGLKPGQWREAYELLENNGFRNVGGEHAFRDNPYYTNILHKYGKTFLNWGETFFREGAESVRSASWYTAYLEHRAENPIGTISRLDHEQILSRASLLDHNMNRSANSLAHTGVMAPAGQFMAYSLRLTELMTGKRLTPIEKFRLFTASSVMYGLPAGASLYGLSFLGDYLREEGKKYGVNIGDNWFGPTILNGAGSALLAYITGGGDIKKGDWYNVSSFGPESYAVLDNALNSSSTIWKIVSGASGGMLYNTVADMRPIWNWGMSFLRPKDQQYPLTAADLFQTAKEISSVYRGDQMWNMLNSGRYVSKAGNYLTDATPFTAAMTGIAGIVPTSVADITVSERAIKEQKDRETTALGLFTQAISRELTAAHNKDFDQAAKFHTQAQAILEIYGYPIEKRAGALSFALQQNESLVSRLDQSYFTRNVPPDERDRRTKLYGRINELEQQKRQP